MLTGNIKKYNDQNYNHVFNELQDYMFTNEFIYKYSKKIKNNDMINKKQINLNNKNITKKETDSFSPEEKDKLFWCFYILHNGVENYEFIKTIAFKTEKEFKFKTAEKIKDYKDVFKSLKLKIIELQDEFINQPCISIKGLIALCYIYNINILYVKKRTYYEIIINNADKINVIINNNDVIELPLNITNEMINSYKVNYWKIDNLNNPLKSVSSYTLLELQTICNKLSIEIKKDNKNLTKQQLYENILKNV